MDRSCWILPHAVIVHIADGFCILQTMGSVTYLHPHPKRSECGEDCLYLDLELGSAAPLHSLPIPQDPEVCFRSACADGVVGAWKGVRYPYPTPWGIWRKVNSFVGFRLWSGATSFQWRDIEETLEEGNLQEFVSLFPLHAFFSYIALCLLSLFSWTTL